jgi:hypothetical protein
MPDRFSYDGGNISPPLEWGGIPDGTAELVLLCEDPDAPGGRSPTGWLPTSHPPRPVLPKANYPRVACSAAMVSARWLGRTKAA